MEKNEPEFGAEQAGPFSKGGGEHPTHDGLWPLPCCPGEKILL
jgi:hypothetical protein